MYLSTSKFAALTLMTADAQAQLAERYPDFLKETIAHVEDRINSRLRKRYAVPFADPAPPTVVGWLVDIVQVKAWLKVGIDETDNQWNTIKGLADAAEAQLLEAADAADGKFDLPLRANTNASGIRNDTPMVYSEQSPYVGFDIAAQRARSEDRVRRGG